MFLLRAPQSPRQVYFFLESYSWFIQEGALPLLIREAAPQILGAAGAAWLQQAGVLRCLSTSVVQW